MKTFVLILIATGLTVGAALMQGAYSGRWGEPVDLSSAAGAIERLPKRLGDWRQVELGDRMDESIQRELGLVNHLNRIYEHEATGRRVQLLLMAGRPGPLVRHPPTVCYANRAHEQLGDPRWIALTDRPDASRFQLLTYRPARSQAGERFFVAYAHYSNGAWDVPAFPRIAYGAAPALFKAQVLLNTDGDEPEAEAIGELADFVRRVAATFDGIAVSDAQPQARNSR